MIKSLHFTLAIRSQLEPREAPGESVHKSMHTSFLSRICQRSSVRRTFQQCSPYNRFAVRRMALPAKATALDVEAAHVVAKDLRTLEVSVLHLPRHNRTDPTCRFLKKCRPARSASSRLYSRVYEVCTPDDLVEVLYRQLQRLTNPRMWMHKCRI
jgi:hypothetical protein